MREAFLNVVQSRGGRTFGAWIGAILTALLVGYILFGPIALHFLAR